MECQTLLHLLYYFLTGLFVISECRLSTPKGEAENVLLPKGTNSDVGLRTPFLSRKEAEVEAVRGQGLHNRRENKNIQREHINIDSHHGEVTTNISTPPHTEHKFALASVSQMSKYFIYDRSHRVHVSPQTRGGSSENKLLIPYKVTEEANLKYPEDALPLLHTKQWSRLYKRRRTATGQLSSATYLKPSNKKLPELGGPDMLLSGRSISASLVNGPAAQNVKWDFRALDQEQPNELTTYNSNRASKWQENGNILVKPGFQQSNKGIQQTLMDIDFSNDQGAQSMSSSVSEGGSQINHNGQFASDVILGHTAGKAAAKSISDDSLNPFQPRKYSGSGKLSDLHKRKRTSERYSNAPVAHKVHRVKRGIRYKDSLTAQKTYFLNEKGLERATRDGSNLFHWSTLSDDDRSDFKYSKPPFVQETPQSVPLASDQNVKSNQHSSIIRHLHHRLLKLARHEHPHSHRRVPTDNSNSVVASQNQVLTKHTGKVLYNNEFNKKSFPYNTEGQVHPEANLDNQADSLLYMNTENSFLNEDSSIQLRNIKSIRKRSEGSQLGHETNNSSTENINDSAISTTTVDPSVLSHHTRQSPTDPILGSESHGNRSSDFALSYRSPFIDSRAARQHEQQQHTAPPAQSQVLEEEEESDLDTDGDDPQPDGSDDQTGNLRSDQSHETDTDQDLPEPLEENNSNLTASSNNTTHSGAVGPLGDSSVNPNQETAEEHNVSVIELDLIQGVGESPDPGSDTDVNSEESPAEPLYGDEQPDGVTEEEPDHSEGDAEAEREGESSVESDTETEVDVEDPNTEMERDETAEPEDGLATVEPEAYPEIPEPEMPEPEILEPESPGPEYPEPGGPEAEGPEPESPIVGPGDEVAPDDGNSYAEAEPDWADAKAVWGAAWEFHIYVAGVGFAILAAYALISMLRLWKQKNLLSLPYFLSLNGVMALMGVTRAIYFLVDAYNTNNTFHPVLYYFLYSVGFPCLTSAFSILFMALLRTTRMQLMSPKIQKTQILLLIIVLHFMISLATDVVVGYFSDASVLMFVCQLATVVWGLLLFIGYLYIFRKLYKNSKWRQREMTRYQLSRIKLEGVTPITKQPKLTLNMAIKVTFVTAIIGLIFAGIMIYSMVGVFSVFSHEVPDPWPWWWFKTSMRIVELAMCSLMVYVATQPFRYNNEITDRKWNCNNAMYYFPCKRLCQCDELELRDDDIHWIGNEVYVDTTQPIPNDIIAFNINPIMVEESIPITMRLSGAGDALNSQYSSATSSMRDSSCSSNQKVLLRGSSSHQTASRPTSLLVRENGLVRFRQEGDDNADPVVLSTEDELDLQDPEVMENPFAAALKQHQSNLLIEKPCSKDKQLEQERNDKLELLLEGHGLILPDKFGESSTEPHYRRSLKYGSGKKKTMYNRAKSAPNGCTTPGSTRSYCSTDTFLDGAASMWSYKPPSSIHLRDSIEDYLDINLHTPDNIDSPARAPSRSNRSKLKRALSKASHRRISSTSDLQSLQEYHDSLQQQGNSQDSMTFSTASDISIDIWGRSPRRLIRSNSDSLTRIPRDLSFPSGYESADSEKGAGKDWEKEQGKAPDNKKKVQNLLNDITEFCTQISD